MVSHLNILEDLAQEDFDSVGVLESEQRKKLIDIWV